MLTMTMDDFMTRRLGTDGAADTRFLPDNFTGPLIYEVYEQSN